MSNNILIYRDSLLPISETFIKNQATFLQSFDPYFMGYHKIKNGLTLPIDKIMIGNRREGTQKSVMEIFEKKIGYNIKFNSFIKKIYPKLIHAHFGPDGLIALPYAKRFNLPLLVTFHGYDATVKDRYLLTQSYNVRRFVKNKHKLINDEKTFYIAISNYIKNKLLDKGFPESRIFTHYIGIDIDRFSIDDSIKRQQSILFVGRLIKNKGCDFFLNSLTEVIKKHPSTQVWIVGDGPERVFLEQQAAKISNNIKFLGVKTNEEIVYLMNKSKIFCAPSIEIETGASEGLGMVFLEAQAMGLPVVSFKTGGIPESVLHEKTGFLAQPGDIHQLTSYILTLIENDELWHKLSFEARKNVLHSFNIKNQTLKLEQIYNDILSK